MRKKPLTYEEHHLLLTMFNYKFNVKEIAKKLDRSINTIYYYKSVKLLINPKTKKK